MPDELSQNEIDELLSGISSSNKNPPSTLPRNSRHIKIYDFKRPDKITRQDVIFFLCDF